MAADTSPPTHPEEQAGAGTVEVTTVPANGKRNKPLIAGITAMVLLFGVVVGGFWAYSRFLNPPAVSPGRVLPPNAVAYVTIDPAPGESQKKAFDEMRHAFESQSGFREAWTEFTDETSDAIGADSPSSTSPALSDFDALSSYLGSKITLALLPPNTDDLESLGSASSREAEGEIIDVLKRNVVSLVDLDFNPLNKKGPLADLKRQSEDGAIVDVAEKYRGIEIRRYVTDTVTLYFSLLTDTSTAVVGADPKPVRTIIDQFVLDEGLKYDPTYKALLADLPPERVATVYVNLTEISRQIRLARDFTEAAGPLEGRGAWMAALSGKPDGLQINVVAQTEFDGASTLLGKQGIDIEVNPRAKPQVSSLYDVPLDSLAFVTGTDLKSVLETALESFQSEDPQGLAQIESDFRDNTGLSLKHDILPLLGGDYIISISASRTLDNPVLALVSQLKLSPESRAKAGEVVPRLIQEVGKGSPVNENEDAGNRFYTLPASDDFAIALTDDRLIHSQDENWAEARERARRVAADEGKGFGGTDKWKAISKHLPVDSNLIAYVDVTAIREMFERNMPEEQEREYRQIMPFLHPIRYILVGSANYSNIETKEPKPISKLRSHTVVFVGIEK